MHYATSAKGSSRNIAVALLCSLLLAACGAGATAGSAAGTTTPATANTAGFFSNPAAAPACSTAQLSVSFSQVGQAAGTVAGELVFTNTSSTYCHLAGWPKVVGVVGQTGATIKAAKVESILGRPAGQKAGAAALVVPNKPVYALFSVPTGVDYGPPCDPAFTYLQVTPPGGGSAIKVPAMLPGLNQLMPGCPGFSVTAVIGNAGPSNPAASTTTAVPSGAGMPACTGQHLQVSIAHSGAAAGQVSATLDFKNVSDLPCSLEGWPSVVGEQTSGTRVVAVNSDNAPIGVAQSAPSPVLLPANGGVAEAQVEGSDLPPGGVGECPTFEYLLVAAPGTRTTSQIPAFLAGMGANMPDCAGIGVTWVTPYQSYGGGQ
ncbi:MAG: DUF4232 domain-containing protein [Nitrospiraceae bacterium]|nr:DUF4232 domain-containing protein [Nitrospiraceae bacterium]